VLVSTINEIRKFLWSGPRQGTTAQLEWSLEKMILNYNITASARPNKTCIKNGHICPVLYFACGKIICKILFVNYLRNGILFTD
jgi:hypothetical protein